MDFMVVNLVSWNAMNASIFCYISFCKPGSAVFSDATSMWQIVFFVDCNLSGMVVKVGLLLVLLDV